MPTRLRIALAGTAWSQNHRVVSTPLPLRFIAFASGGDHFKNDVQLLVNVGVPKPQNPISARFEELVPVAIAFCRLVVEMHAAINLDDSFAHRATEIDDATIDDMLATESQTNETAAAQSRPQRCLGGRHFLSEYSREIAQALIVVQHLSPGFLGHHCGPLTPNPSPRSRRIAN